VTRGKHKQPERLNEAARKGCESLNTTDRKKGREESPKRDSRLEIGHKSNRMLILRDYIVSAASEIFAGGGANNDNPTNLGVSDFSLVATTLDTNNAKLIGVVKPLVIDLEVAA
jgi:hypothetical protein